MKRFFAGWVDKYFIKKPKLRRWVTSVLERDRDLNIRLFGTKLRINARKEYGYLRASRRVKFHSVLRDEAGSLISLSLLLARGDTFIDIGANVGLFVCTVARMRSVWPEMRFYAFEANPDTSLRLAESARSHGIQLRQVAVSDHDGQQEFLTGAVSNVFAERGQQNDYHFVHQAPVTVSCVRLDQCEIEGNSMVLKIDVEGQEAEVLRGASGLFGEDKIKAVYLDGYKSDDAVEFLRRHGFKFFDGRTFEPVTPPVFSLLAVKFSKCG